MRVVETKLFERLLKFKFPFVIAHGTREHTNALFLELKVEFNHEVITGWGEATIPPYLSENIESVKHFISQIEWGKITDEASALSLLKSLRHHLDRPCGQTIIEMAVLDVISQCAKVSLREYLKLSTNLPEKYCSYTLTLCQDIQEIEKKMQLVSDFSIFKIKFTSDEDFERFKKMPFLKNKKFMVDANQAFKKPDQALNIINKLNEYGCIAIEQPMGKDQWDESTWLKVQSPIPIIADESFQNNIDLSLIKKSFHGINIKILKLGGVLPALELLERAKVLNLIVQVGCMSESSLGCSYALALIDHASYIDLDGPLLISNDPFKGIEYNSNGKIHLPYKIGIGAKPSGLFCL